MPGCAWLRLAGPGLSLAVRGCAWPCLAVPGCIIVLFIEGFGRIARRPQQFLYYWAPCRKTPVPFLTIAIASELWEAGPTSLSISATQPSAARHSQARPGTTSQARPGTARHSQAATTRRNRAQPLTDEDRYARPGTARHAGHGQAQPGTASGGRLLRHPRAAKHR